jgi:cob(I)alamin adenosyltransferase
VKIYTKSGDGGETGLFGGRRVPKDHIRLQAYGSIDELNSLLGVVLVNDVTDKTREILHWLQNILLNLGTDLATPAENLNTSIKRIGSDLTPRAEAYIDELTVHLPELKNFILPGGTPAAAHLHVARTVCRRAEREIVALAAVESINENVSIFVNRLSDLLFVLARYENSSAGKDDTIWKQKN